MYYLFNLFCSLSEFILFNAILFDPYSNQRAHSKPKTTRKTALSERCSWSPPGVHHDRRRRGRAGGRARRGQSLEISTTYRWS